MSTATAPPQALLRETETCWRRAQAERLAWLIDGEAFFGTLGRALLEAREQILLLGWDFHSRMRLWRKDPPADVPETFLDLLEHCVRTHPSLQVHALCWDFSTLFVLEREPLPRIRFSALTHPRIHFRLDAAHPPLGSHHQKLVVIDDALAFVGGFDITQNRWDTRAHAPKDERRRDPSGTLYGPFHDVQTLISGGAAASVGELARSRWEMATGERLDRPERRTEVWPDETGIDGEAVEIALARTLPEHAGRPAVHEVEHLYLEMIAIASRWIYVENQYLTSDAIGRALCDRLREPEGPEIVIVGPEKASGWLEQATMDVLRSRLCAQLREADHAGRLRLLRPHVPDLEQPLNVHAKVMIVDDRIARVGSANLSNRSMGLDSECDLVVDAADQPSAAATVRRLLHELLGEHLDASPERVARAVDETGSLVGAIEALSQSPRTLVPLDMPEPDWSTELVATGLSVADPEGPASLDTLSALFPEDPIPLPVSRSSYLLRIFIVGLSTVSLLMLWRFTPLSGWLDPQALERLATPIRESAFGPLVGLAGFVVLVHLLFPVTVLIAASALVFGGGPGFVVAWLGTLISVISGHWLGRTWLFELVEANAGRVVERLNRLAARRGILASAVIRLLPIAPFQLVNVAVGASRIRLRDFVIGSQLALTPGIAALALASDGLWQLLLDPTRENVSWALVFAAGALLATIGLAAWASRQQERWKS